jgi:hypothetical protein
VKRNKEDLKLAGFVAFVNIFLQFRVEKKRALWRWAGNFTETRVLKK